MGGLVSMTPEVAAPRSALDLESQRCQKEQTEEKTREPARRGLFLWRCLGMA